VTASTASKPPKDLESVSSRSAETMLRARASEIASRRGAPDAEPAFA